MGFVFFIRPMHPSLPQSPWQVEMCSQAPLPVVSVPQVIGYDAGFCLHARTCKNVKDEACCAGRLP